MSSTRRRTAAAVAVSLPLVALPATLPAAGDDGPVEAGIHVTKVENLPEDFLAGVDVSSVLSLEESGVVFRDEAGQEADLFTVLADAGITDVRVRVWNDPYDAEGHGYGGGTVDVARAVEIGERATAAGLDVLVNFHYSDFWADPGKQRAPKAWEALTQAERVAAVGEFTTEALEAFADAGVAVTMVQVGNETNNAVAGLSGWDAMAEVFSAGSAAVRAVFPDAKVVLHFTNPETPGRYAGYAAALAARDVDYDVFASSYYPFWHGTTTNLTSVLTQVADTYGKEVLVAEVSWVHTLEDGDGHENTIRTAAAASAYPVGVQGQATAVRDVVDAVAAVGEAGIGVFYWEPAWLPVGPPDQVEANRVLWERDGSGWATSFAGDYDPDAAEWHGGTSWDNQALFDFAGNPLESLRIFRYVRTGAVAPLEVVAVEAVALTVADGEPVELPATVEVTYNDGSVEDRAVTWSDAVAWIRGPGVYTVSGVVDGGLTTTATITVAGVNHVVNPSFEDADRSMWTVTGTGVAIEWSGDATDGEYGLKFWLDSAFAFTLNQDLAGVPAGVYTASAVAHGDGSGERTSFVVATSEGEYAVDMALAGWNDPRTAVIDAVVVGEDGLVSIGADFALVAGSWGTLDEFVLTPAADGADTTAVAELVTQAEAVDRAAYTPGSLAVLDAAVEVARVLLAGSRPTEADVEAVAALLEDALAGLIALPAFSDVGPDHPFREEILALATAGIITGYPDGAFGPARPVSRQASAAFLHRALVGEAAASCAEAPFSDVPVDHPFCGEIAALAEAGIVAGYGDGTFGPGRQVSRQAAAAYLARAFGPAEVPACTEAVFTDVAADHPFCGEIAWLVEEGIATGYSDGSFGPGDVVSRQAMAAFLHRALG